MTGAASSISVPKGDGVKVPSTGTPMIEVSELRKFYGDFEALKGISFTVGKGEIVGFLGPNGAGKTTTMKILTGFISATSGRFAVAGHDGFQESLELRRAIGYLPENAPMYPDMGIVEYLEFIAEIRKIPSSKRRARIFKMVELVGLGPMIKKNIGELSKGYRQRVGLAQAMIHEPPVLILDEPTSGLDPNQIVEIRRLIKDLGREHTIILSTHNLPEVQATCSRMIIISGGRKVADGTADQLEREGRQSSRFVLNARLPTGGEPYHVRTQLGALPGVTSAEEAGHADGAHRFTISTSGSETELTEAIFSLAVREGWALRELRRDVVDLEQIFHRLTQY